MVKVWIVEDEYDYFMTTSKWESSPSIEITEEVWNAYNKHQLEKEGWQDFIEELYKKAKEETSS